MAIDTSLERHIREMRVLASLLSPHSFPEVSPKDEEVIAPLKQREVSVDGYDVVVFFSTCSYGQVRLETLQLYGKDFSFLPFTVICKLARRFLGDEGLAYVEVMHHGKDGGFDGDSRKIHIWTVYYADGQRISSPFAKELKSCHFDGLRYAQMTRDEINFI